MDPVEKVDSAVRRFLMRGVLSGTELILVGVSGGPDSLVLLDALARVEPPLLLHVIHFDHRLRPDSPGDAETVRHLALERGLPVSVGVWQRDGADEPSTLNVLLSTAGGAETPGYDGAPAGGAEAPGYNHVIAPSRVPSGCRLPPLSEASARAARYRFFGQCAVQLGARWLMVAHTADDQVETVLARLVRGSGPAGLAGMRPMARIPGLAGDLTVVRPLLDIDRQTILEYCRARNLTPLIDSSNESPIYQRNRLRSQVVPLLRRENPRLAEAVGRAAKSLAELQEFARSAVLGRWDELAEKQRNGIALRRSVLVDLHPALQREAILAACEIVAGAPAPIEARHLELVIEALHRSSWAIDAPGGLTIRLSKDRLAIQMRWDAEVSPERVLEVPGAVEFAGWCIRAERLRAVDPRLSSTGVRIWTADPGPFTVRGRRPGDAYRPLGAPGRRKVHDLLIDRKIPAQLRSSIPLLVGASGIVWLVGHRVADDAKVDPAAGWATRLTAVPIGEIGENRCQSTYSSP